MAPRLSITTVDITTLDVDAVVNAANTSLLGGGGVDGAIHRSVGPALLAEGRTLSGSATGDAKITDGHCLLARHVIHAVGPVWRGGTQRETSLIAGCYRRAMQLATERSLKTIAFAAISCGVYGYPAELAARVAVDTVSTALETAISREQVYFVCFQIDVKHAYESELRHHPLGKSL